MISAATQTFRLRMAKQKAEALLRDEGITALPVDPLAIAASRDIAVKPKPDTVEGVSGMLLRHGDVFGILYATHIPSEGFQRFSVGHELGHYFLEGHIDHLLPRTEFTPPVPDSLSPILTNSKPTILPPGS
jgi:hypothetical protein